LKSLQEFTITDTFSFETKPVKGYPERRKKRRIRPTVLSGIMEARDQRYVVTIHDLSLIGARVMNAPPYLELGEKIWLSIMIEGQPVHPYPCTVIHKNGNEAHLEVGVRFEPLEQENSGGLEWYLRESLES